MALMMCVVSLGSVIFQRANNLLGEDIIAAHSTSHKIFTVFLQPISAMSAALSTFVSQNYGAGRYERIRFSLGRILILQAIWGVLSCISVYLTGGALVHLLTATENEYIVSNAVMSMRICLPFFPVLGALQCLRTAMQSMGYKTAPVISSCIEVLVKIIGAAFIIPAYGYLGSCVTEPLTWTVMAAFLALSYLILRKKIYKMHAD
jgi:Na+-driven multidrug efflux pump